MPTLTLRTKSTKKVKRSNSRATNGRSNLSLATLKFRTYLEVKEEIDKKVGARPARPRELSKGNWTKQALKVLQERYLTKDEKGETVETPEDMVWRVSWEVASAEARWGKTKKQVMEAAKEFYELMASHEFLPNSPTLMNAGTGNMLQYSACFVLPVEDSIEGIFDALKYQALIHKSGGGTGFSFSRLRPGGSMVKSSSGTASGPISFMRIFDAATNEIKQGGKRRGANMGILRVDHPDIMEFIHCKEEGGITNFNISAAVTDKFMDAYYKNKNYELIDPKTKRIVGKLNARKVFDEISDGAWRTGDPGLVFIDRRNRGSSNPVPALGPIEATNPCVTGDTLISTDNGLIRIKDIYKSKLSVKILVDSRLGEKKFYTPVRVIKTGFKDVYQLTTKEGFEVSLTADHKVLTTEGWKKAGKLATGDKILIANEKGGFGKFGSIEEGQIMGWLVGDGTLKATSAVLSFFGQEKRELAPKFANMVSTLVDGMQILHRDYPVRARYIEERDEARVESARLLRYLIDNGLVPGDKLKVPVKVLRGSEEMQRGFLEAIFTADGHVEGVPEKGASVRLTSTSEGLLRNVQRLLLNFGIASKIYTERRKRGLRSMPDGKGGKKDYLCKAYHDLVVSKENLWGFAREIGFLVEYKNAKLVDTRAKYKEGVYKEKFEVTFEKLIYRGEKWVFDLTEPVTHSFIANGLVLHNCGEQELYPFDACNLGSIFLTYFVKENPSTGSGPKREVDWDKLKKVIALATRFLDDVIEVNPYPLAQIRQTVLAIRRIGLGVGGWADMLVELGIPYDSEEALSLAEKIMKTIQDEAVNTSKELARERGPFPLWPISIYRKEAPRRNSTVTTIAPTGTISIIAGASSGIEPLFAIAFQHIVRDKHLKRKLSFVNPKFEEIARQRGFWSEEIKAKVAEKGVIRDIEEIPEEVRALFGTAHEIDPEWHVRVQAVFQKYTENAVSKTINLRHDASVDDIKKAYLMAWETNCKGITVFRDGSKDAQVLNLGLKEGEKKEEESSEPLKVRPFKVIGSTYKLQTPVGNAFVTINQDEAGDPLEIFINVGKAGSDVAAMAEALGRTISTALRFRGSLSAKDRAYEIAKQLAGIGGRRSVGFGPNKIRSLPDAISAALSTHYGFKVNGNGNHSILEIGNGAALAASNVAGAVMAAVLPSPKGTGQAPLESLNDPTTASASFNEAQAAIGDICPSCGASSLVYEEGCSKCYSCGHSEC